MLAKSFPRLPAVTGRASFGHVCETFVLEDREQSVHISAVVSLSTLCLCYVDPVIVVHFSWPFLALAPSVEKILCTLKVRHKLPTSFSAAVTFAGWMTPMNRES